MLLRGGWGVLNGAVLPVALAALLALLWQMRRARKTA
jgi:hypothetical protein